MYNEEQKIRFIKDATKSVSTATAMEYMFNRFEKYERAWGKDVCQASDSEIQELIDNVFGVRSGTSSVYKTRLRKYIMWCVKHHVENVRDPIIYLAQNTKQRQTGSYVANPIHLQRCLDMVFDSEESRTVDNIYRSYFWLAFSGIGEKYIRYIRRSDVDLNNMSVICNGKEFPIYRDGIKALRNAVRLDSFVYKHPNYNKEIERKRFDDIMLLSGIKGMSTEETFRSQVSTIALRAAKNNDCVIRLSYDKVRMSGIFYRAYEIERAFGHVDLSEEIDNRVNEGVASGNNMKLGAYKYQVGIRLNADYKRWKAMFEPCV